MEEEIINLSRSGYVVEDIADEYDGHKEDVITHIYQNLKR